MLKAYEGYFEDGQFFPLGAPINITKRRRVILTVLDEDVSVGSETTQAAALRDFFDAVNASDEKIPEVFDRVNFSQEVNL